MLTKCVQCQRNQAEPFLHHMARQLPHIWYIRPEALHEDSRASVRAYGKISEKFAVTTGVKQGYVLASTLFNLFFDTVIRMALEDHMYIEQQHGVSMLYHSDAELVGNRKMRQLLYADDMALVADIVGKVYWQCYSL